MPPKCSILPGIYSGGSLLYVLGTRNLGFEGPLHPVVTSGLSSVVSSFAPVHRGKLARLLAKQMSYCGIECCSPLLEGTPSLYKKPLACTHLNECVYRNAFLHGHCTVQKAAQSPCLPLR